MVRAAQDKFEEMLIDFGLLKAGVEATSDEISRSVTEEATATADSIRKSTSEYVCLSNYHDNVCSLTKTVQLPGCEPTDRLACCLR